MPAKKFKLNCIFLLLLLLLYSMVTSWKYLEKKNQLRNIVFLLFFCCCFHFFYYHCNHYYHHHHDYYLHTLLLLLFLFIFVFVFVFFNTIIKIQWKIYSPLAYKWWVRPNVAAWMCLLACLLFTRRETVDLILKPVVCCNKTYFLNNAAAAMQCNAMQCM